MQLGLNRMQPGNFSFPNLASQMVAQATGQLQPQSVNQAISSLGSMRPGAMPTYASPAVTGRTGFNLPQVDFSEGLSLSGGGNPTVSSLVQDMGTPGQGSPGMWGRVDDWVGKNFNNWGDAMKTGFAGVETLGKLWSAFQMNKMAKQQFNFSKDMANTNLANQITAFNTTLSDRARSRAVYEGQSDAERDAYIEENKARDTRENRG